MDQHAEMTCRRCDQIATVYPWSVRSASALENALPVGWVVRREYRESSGRAELTVYCPRHADQAPGGRYDNSRK